MQVPVIFPSGTGLISFTLPESSNSLPVVLDNCWFSEPDSLIEQITGTITGNYKDGFGHCRFVFDLPKKFCLTFQFFSPIDFQCEYGWEGAEDGDYLGRYETDTDSGDSATGCFDRWPTGMDNLLELIVDRYFVRCSP